MSEQQVNKHNHPSFRCSIARKMTFPIVVRTEVNEAMS